MTSTTTTETPLSCPRVRQVTERSKPKAAAAAALTAVTTTKPGQMVGSPEVEPEGQAAPDEHRRDLGKAQQRQEEPAADEELVEGQPRGHETRQEASFSLLDQDRATTADREKQEHDGDSGGEEGDRRSAAGALGVDHGDFEQPLAKPALRGLYRSPAGQGARGPPLRHQAQRTPLENGRDDLAGGRVGGVDSQVDLGPTNGQLRQVFGESGTERTTTAAASPLRSCRKAG